MGAKVPKNIRFRADQITDLQLELELEDDKEKDFSKLVRIAVDDLLAKRRAERVSEDPARFKAKRRGA